MMTAEDQLIVFQGVKRRDNTPVVLSERATMKSRQLVTAPRGCGDNRAGGCVGFVLTARKGMRARSRLASARSYRNSLYAIKSAFPEGTLEDR